MAMGDWTEEAKAIEELVKSLTWDIMVWGEKDILMLVDDVVHKAAIEACLDKNAGNQVHTASDLGINRNTLRKYMKRFGLMDREPKNRRSYEQQAAH